MKKTRFDKRMLLVLLMLAGVFNVIGCAGGEKFKPIENISSDKATVYIYRPSTGLFGAGYNIQIYVNGEMIGLLSNNGYCYCLCPEKSITVSYRQNCNALVWGPIIALAESKQKPMELLSFDAEAGVEYYLHFSYNAVLTQKDKEDALPKIRKCKLQNYKNTSPKSKSQD